MEAHEPAHHHHHQHQHQHQHPPHVSHSPHHLHHQHHHQLPPPTPFLCARCKCWNFPNPYPYHNPAVCLQAQELPALNPNDASTVLQAQGIPSDRFDEDEEDEEEGYEFVMTDEWMEFFAKSEARRQEKKRQQKKAARDMRKATRARSQAQEPSTAE